MIQLPPEIWHMIIMDYKFDNARKRLERILEFPVTKSSSFLHQSFIETENIIITWNSWYPEHLEINFFKKLGPQPHGIFWDVFFTVTLSRGINKTLM